VFWWCGVIVVLCIFEVWYDCLTVCFGGVVCLLSCVYWWCGMFIVLCVLVVRYDCCPACFDCVL